MTNKNNTTETPKSAEQIPTDELYYDPRRAAKQLVEPDLSNASGLGAGFGVEAQHEQILSAEHFKATQARKDLEQSQEIALQDIDNETLDKEGGNTRARKSNAPMSERAEMRRKRTEVEGLRTYEGDPAPDGSDHVVGVDWYNNKTVTTDDHLKSPEQLAQVQDQRVEQGAAPGTKKDDSAGSDVARSDRKEQAENTNKDVPKTKVK